MSKLALAVERIERTLGQEWRNDSNWNEGDHPRAANGQFGSGGGGGAAKSGGGGEAPKSSAPAKSGGSRSLTKHPELVALFSEMNSSGVKVKASGNSIEVKDPTPIGAGEDELQHRIDLWGPAGPYGKYLAGLGMSAKVEGDFTWTGPKGRESFSNGYTVLKIELQPKQ